ncbi:MAG: AbrB/MazE/SpoVT family DNA-binding domain-containing protein [Chloroflexota bacterium]
MARATMSAKGWVVIPKVRREKYGLTPGRSVEVIDYGGVVSIIPIPADPIRTMAGMFAREGGGSWTEELLEERRRERERDERRLGH